MPARSPPGSPSRPEASAASGTSSRPPAERRTTWVVGRLRGRSEPRRTASGGRAGGGAGSANSSCTLDRGGVTGVSISASSAGRSRKPRRSVAGDVVSRRAPRTSSTTPDNGELRLGLRHRHRRRRGEREIVAAVTAPGRLLEPDVAALRALHGRVRSPPADMPRPAARSSSCCIRPRRTCASAYARSPGAIRSRMASASGRRPAVNNACARTR